MSQYGVVITGRGLVCSAGHTLEKSVDSFLNGKPCLHIVPDQRLTENYGVHLAGLIPNLPAVEHSTTLTSVMDRFVQLALIAAQEASLTCGDALVVNPERTGIILGTCSGPMNTIEEMYKMDGNGNSEHDPSHFLARQYYSAAMILAERFGVRGPAFTVTTACSAFTVAVGIASDLIRMGMLDTVLVGGSDAFSATTQAGFNGLKATCKDETCAPFSKPIGLNLGEGAGFIVLENKNNAIKRNAAIHGEILGYGLSNDAWHCSAPDPSGKGAALSMQRALDNAGISTDQILYINAHGTGTEANDKAETKAIRRVFGDHADRVKVSSLKSVTGHCLGAAGAVETVASLECIRNGFLPPTAHFTEARDGCTLDYIPESGTQWVPGSIMLKNNFAFGGNNASVCISDGKREYPVKQIENSDDPVCISAIGLVSAAGFGIESICDGSAVQLVDHKENGLDFKVAHVQDFNMASIDRRIDIKGVDKEAKHAIAAAVTALAGAKITEKPKYRQDLGFIMNIAHGSTWAEAEHIVPLLKNNFKLEQINAFPYIVPNSLTGTICRTLSLTGYNSTLCNGPGAGLMGLMMAWVAIKNNHTSSFLCGTSDYYSKAMFDCVCTDREYAKQGIIGEGSAMYVVERWSTAESRGVKPLCSILSTSSFNSIDDTHSENRMQCAINIAVESAGIAMCDIGVVSCNLSETRKKNIEKLFGNVNCIDVSSVTGFAPCSQPLFNLAAAITRSPFVESGDKKYILAVSSANNGNNCVMVLKNNS